MYSVDVWPFLDDLDWDHDVTTIAVFGQAGGSWAGGLDFIQVFGFSSVTPCQIYCVVEENPHVLMQISGDLCRAANMFLMFGMCNRLLGEVDLLLKARSTQTSKDFSTDITSDLVELDGYSLWVPAGHDGTTPLTHHLSPILCILWIVVGWKQFLLSLQDDALIGTQVLPNNFHADNEDWWEWREELPGMLDQTQTRFKGFGASGKYNEKYSNRMLFRLCFSEDWDCILSPAVSNLMLGPKNARTLNHRQGGSFKSSGVLPFLGGTGEDRFTAVQSSVWSECEGLAEVWSGCIRRLPWMHRENYTEGSYVLMKLGITI